MTSRLRWWQRPMRYQELLEGWRERIWQLLDDVVQRIGWERRVIRSAMDEEEECVQIAQSKVPDRRVLWMALDEPVPMDARQREPHLVADDVQVGLELPLAQRKLICELFSRQPGVRGDVLDDGPDSLESVCDEPLAVQAMLLIERRKSG